MDVILNRLTYLNDAILSNYFNPFQRLKFEILNKFHFFCFDKFAYKSLVSLCIYLKHDKKFKQHRKYTLLVLQFKIS